MFGPRIQQSARRIAEMVVRPLAAIGMTPNMATLLGLLLNALTAAVLATGHLRIGGVMLLFAGLFDMVDGALARVRNLRTTFGAFFDSTLDRYSEGIVVLGVILFALSLPAGTRQTWIVALAYVAGLSSLIVSYARARAEGLGLNGKSGLMARPERVLLLAAGLIIGGADLLVWTVGLLALTSTFTAVQRIVAVWRTLASQDPQTPAPTSAPAATGAGEDGASAEAPARRDGHQQLGRRGLFPRGGTGALRARRRDAASRSIASERPANR
jgi:CDP-diacylglycerol--glycerol-3-phosphate 3-phosphatidyltransferase